MKENIQTYVWAAQAVLAAKNVIAEGFGVHRKKYGVRRSFGAFGRGDLSPRPTGEAGVEYYQTFLGYNDVIQNVMITKHFAGFAGGGRAEGSARPKAPKDRRTPYFFRRAPNRQTFL